MISFIIPAHDEESVIGSTVRAVQTAAREAGEPFEVIVVDDASTDATAQRAAAAGARVTTIDRRQIAAARNAGAAVARGETLVFVDADTLIDAAVVRAVVLALRGGAIGGGAAFRFDEPTPVYARIILPPVLWVYRRLGLASGCFVYCTRAAFDAVSGFDEKLFAAEEAVMSRALQKVGRFVILREAVVTSGRKLRTHSPWEILGLLTRVAWGGGKTLRTRRQLDLWYGPRRKDPTSSSG